MVRLEINGVFNNYGLIMNLILLFLIVIKFCIRVSDAWHLDGGVALGPRFEQTGRLSFYFHILAVISGQKDPGRVLVSQTALATAFTRLFGCFIIQTVGTGFGAGRGLFDLRGGHGPIL